MHHERAPKDADEGALAEAYSRLFPLVYAAFHRRDDKGRELSGASRAVLLHLAQSGPITVSDCAKHFQRSQSATSELILKLEENELVAGMQDPDDRRRTLVWLTETGRARLIEEQQVLSPQLLSRALSQLSPETRAQLIDSTRALITAADQLKG
jgi:DNA-binding MarR family transcriptional regulator